ncbi:MAG: NifU family protein [Anaerolineae bacterium]|nr:NifU family protein [Anaerolineae bacterium]
MKTENSVEQEEILEITESAKIKIKELIDSRERQNLAVRVVVNGRLPGGGYQTEFKFVGLDDQQAGDSVQDTGMFKLLFDDLCANSIRGALVDFDESKYSAGFHIDYRQDNFLPPGVEQRRDWTHPLELNVQEIIDNQVNPGVASHDGWVLLLDVDVDEGIAYIEMGGGCQGCGASDITMKMGIEQLITHQVPDIKRVIDRTEHAEGKNPYYAPAGGGDSPFG